MQWGSFWIQKILYCHHLSDVSGSLSQCKKINVSFDFPAGMNDPFLTISNLI